MNEIEALSQFIDVKNDKNRCKKCAQELFKKSEVYPDTYFLAPWGKPQIQVCVQCFDADIKSRMF